jgi:hypothetical protein
MSVRALLAIVLAAGASAAAGEPVPDDFAFGCPVIAAEPAAGYRVALPIEVYRNSVRADLGDLRVFNAKGEVVPYALRRPRLDSVQKMTPRTLPLFPLTGTANASLDAIRVTIESGRGAVNVETQGAGGKQPAIVSYIVDARSIERPLAALAFEWPADAAEFAGRLRVEATDNLSDWRTVLAGAAVANLGTQADRLVERRVEFTPLKAKYWRLTWVDGQAPFRLTSVQAEPSENVVELARESLTLPAATDAQQPGEFTFDSNAQLPVDRVKLELPEVNSIVQAEISSRAAATVPWHYVARRGFYRLNGRGGEIASGWVSVPYNGDRYWQVKIDSKTGGLGSQPPKLTLGWIPHELMFIARGAGPFQVVYGSVDAQPAEAAVESILPAIATPDAGTALVKIATATLGPEVTLGGAARRQAPPSPYPWKTIVLWSALGLGVLVLGFMAARLSRETKRPE